MKRLRTCLVTRLVPLAPLALALAMAPCVSADVKLPALFTDHMVLQRDAAVPVWGWAEPGEAVTVSIAGQTTSTKADSNGKWQVKLKPLKERKLSKKR